MTVARYEDAVFAQNDGELVLTDRVFEFVR